MVFSTHVFQVAEYYNCKFAKKLGQTIVKFQDLLFKIY